MEKNTFLMINDMIYDLYSCTSLNEIKAKFLLRLKMVIPYSYASILLHETTEDPDTIRLTTPICIPEAFTEAENEYMKVADEDHLLWLLHSWESSPSSAPKKTALSPMKTCSTSRPSACT